MRYVAKQFVKVMRLLLKLCESSRISIQSGTYPELSGEETAQS